MELRVLRYFLEVARTGNITKTAQYLHVSQPTLSRQLKNLEEELGKKLFIRSNYSIKLTEEGFLLRDRAEDILGMVDRTEAEFKSLDEFNGGDIHIGSAESNGIVHFIKILKRMQEKYPRIRYHFYSSGTETVNERLDKGLLDFAIIIQEPEASKYNFLKIPSYDRWGIIMRKDDKLARKTYVEAGDLKNIPLILSRQTILKEMPAWFGEMQDKLNIVATYDLIFNTSVMVKEKFGYALGFDGLLDTSESSVLCFRPLKPQLCSPMYVIWKKHQIFSQGALLLLKELKKEFASV